MTRRLEACLALTPVTMPPTASRALLAASPRAVVLPTFVGGVAVGLVALRSDDPVAVVSALGLPGAAVLSGAARCPGAHPRRARDPDRGGVGPRARLQGARRTGELEDDVVPLVAAPQDAVRRKDQAGVDRAASDVQALVQARGLDAGGAVTGQ